VAARELGIIDLAWRQLPRCKLQHIGLHAVASEPADLELSRRGRLPVVLAAEGAECGLACLAMVARFHGHDIDLNGLRQRFALSLTGASLNSLMSVADGLELSARPRRA
jgi:peptidase C39-like protein